MSALFFINKKKEVTYNRRVKVGFVFEFNRFISNYIYACNDCNITIPTFSVEMKTLN